MNDLPVMLNVHQRRCVIVGGGKTACRRARSLLESGALVTLVAPRIDVAFDDPNITTHQRPFEPGDLHDAFLVVIATDNPSVNQAAADEARRVGALINRADDPTHGDLTFPAHRRHGPITLAVHTGGISASAAAHIIRDLSESLDPDWSTLIELAAPCRSLIQQRFTDPRTRHARLAQLTDHEAMLTLKLQGLDALIAHLQSIVNSDPSAAAKQP
jgi:precorrin-2 dehydrogenase / sirohydrochlorin ferrochelatase